MRNVSWNSETEYHIELMSSLNSMVVLWTEKKNRICSKYENNCVGSNQWKDDGWMASDLDDT